MTFKYSKQLVLTLNFVRNSSKGRKLPSLLRRSTTFCTPALNHDYTFLCKSDEEPLQEKKTDVFMFSFLRIGLLCEDNSFGQYCGSVSVSGQPS